MTLNDVLKRTFIIVFVFFGMKTFAQSQNDQITVADFYKKKAETYLLKDSIDAYNQLAFKEEGLCFYKDSLEKSGRKRSYFISWENLENLKEDFGNQAFDSLYKKFVTNNEYIINSKLKEKLQKKRIKIAISPGHLARNFTEAKYERKYIEFSDGKTKFYEADLNLRTALILKIKLQEKGFDVYLTRTDKKPDVWDLGFNEWKKQKFDIALKECLDAGEFSNEQVEWFKKEATEEQIFKYLYAKLELRKRAERINSFNPDITIAIHYNVNEKNTEWKTATNKNYMMAFVPGSFLKNELEKPLDQFNFLRLLVTDDIEKSIQLSSEFIKLFFEMTSIPIAKTSDAIYLENFSLVTEEDGVYSRNLAMTRLVNSPILYGEPLYQDNKKMSKSLNVHNPDKNKKGISKYVKKVSKAYYESILSYVAKQHDYITE